METVIAEYMDFTTEYKLWSLRFSVTIILAILVLYVLSTGPVWWLHKHGFLSKPAFVTIYQPVGYFIEHSPADIFYRYIAKWSPVIEF